MAFKDYFKGKKGAILWGNILLMLIVLMGVPVLALFLLDTHTHHGEKIEVPSVIGKSSFDAKQMLAEKELECIIADSTYNSDARPGVVLDQSPRPGSEVKSGRTVYLTVNLNGEPLVKVPRLDGSLREVEAALKALGFRLTENEIVYDRDKDLVIGVKQDNMMLHEGEKVSREKWVTIVVGGGEELDTISDFAGIGEYADSIDFNGLLR